MIDCIGENHFFIGKITNAVSNFVGFSLKPLSNVRRVNVYEPGRGCLPRRIVRQKMGKCAELRQTDTASGRYRAVVRTGAGVGSLEVRLSSHSDPPDPRESRRPARVALNSGVRLSHGLAVSGNVIFAVTLGRIARAHAAREPVRTRARRRVDFLSVPCFVSIVYTPRAIVIACHRRRFRRVRPAFNFFGHTGQQLSEFLLFLSSRAQLVGDDGGETGFSAAQDVR